MKTSFRYIIIAVLTCLASIPSSQGQTIETNDIFYHSFRSPWAVQSNPALFPKNASFYITLPQIDFSIGSPVNYNELGLSYNSQTGKSYLNLNTLVDNIDKSGTGVTPNVDVNLLGVGFRAGKHLHFTLDAGLHVSGVLYVPTEITKLLEGNIDESGEGQAVSIEVNKVSNIISYANTSLGVSYDIGTIPLTVGICGNVLFGLEYVSISKMQLNILTAPDLNSMSATADYLGQTAGLGYLTKNSDGKTELEYNLAFPSSIGFTLDFGAHYKLKDFDFSLSMLNIGPGITWKDNVYQIVPKDPDNVFTFYGVDASMESNGINIDTATLSSLGDSLIKSIDFKTPGYSQFTTALPTKIYAGVSYTFKNWVRAGYLFHGEFLNGLKKGSTFVCNNTLSIHGNLYDWLEIGVANSFTFDGGKADFFNPGISASINLGRVFQITAAVDYVSSLYATQVKSAHVLFGLSIVGYKKPAKENNQIPSIDNQPILE